MGITIFDLLKNPELKNKKVVEKLIEYYMNLPRQDLFTSYDKEVDPATVDKIVQGHHDYYYNKKPLEFIVGYVEFFGNKFKVNENTLIPRPETEYMIKAVNDFLANINTDILIDVGTGCGVLGTSTIFFNKDKVKRAILCDLSKEALEVAKENYSSLIKDPNFPVKFLISDLIKDVGEVNEKNILIVANLPYIPDQTFEDNVEDNVKKWEPKMAFVGGEDGLDLYRIMFNQMFENYADRNITMFLEMMTWQAEILEKEFGDKISFEMVETFHFNIKIVKAILK